MKELKLIGKRITLRPLKSSDVKDIYLNIQNKKIAENILDMPWPYSIRDAQKFIKKMQKARQKKSDFAFGIESKTRKEVIGCIGLYKINFKHKNGELGYWLGPKYWNQGIMTEAGKLVLDFAFSKLKLHRVWGGAFSNNLASQKVLKNLGFKKEGVFRQAFWHFDCWRDGIHYGLLSKEFLKK
ncbi:GNAT family N-acetyltransferase [Patescibacteria group bacterium]|nr:GNAT family N-acetyltransferase [Patescibacteria group bacterium]MBU4481126.1 GNAT family N-acetyltransferase [Patescibacteria group bacterium]